VDPNPAESAVKKYVPSSSQITPDSIQEFVDQFNAGTLTPHLRSDPNPRSPAGSSLPIRALNTESFKALFNDESESAGKDVFVFFSGAACFICHEIWPDFEKLVRVVQEKSPNLIFAYIDLSKNELQEYA